MEREIFIVLNVSTGDVEIRDFGVIIPPDVSIDLADFDRSILSEEVDFYLDRGDLVRLIDGVSVGYSKAFASNIPLSTKYLPESSINYNTFFFDSSSLLDVSVGKYDTKKFLAGKSTTQVLTGSYSDVISWDTEIINDSTLLEPVYTWDETTGILTFGESGWYDINLNMNTDVLSGGTRAMSYFKAQENTGSGYSDIPYSETAMYNRTSGDGGNSGAFHTFRFYSSGDSLKLQAYENGGDNQIISSQISIVKSEIGRSLTIYDVSGGVSQNYVDGSLLRRDLSLNIIFNNELGFLYESSIGQGFIFNGTTDQYDVSISGAVGLYAWARTAANGTNIDSYQLNVSKGGTGVYNYTFKNSLATTAYGIIGQPFSTLTDTNIQISNVTTAGFTLTAASGDNGTTPDVPVDTEHTVMVLGPPTEIGLGVSRDYVDGSLALRDISINQNLENISSILLYQSIQDTSIILNTSRLDIIDGSIVYINNVNTIQDSSIIYLDSSVNQLFQELSALDASLTQDYVLKAGDTMTGDLILPGLVAQQDISVYGDASFGGNLALTQKLHLEKHNNASPELGDLWTDPSGKLYFAHPIHGIDASSYDITNRLLRTDNDWGNFPDSSTLDDGDRILIEDAQDGFKKKYISAQAFAEGVTGGFGQFSSYADSLAISSTTSGTFQTKLSLTTDASAIEDIYRVGWTLQITNGNNNQNAAYQVTVDGDIIDSNDVTIARAGAYQCYAGFQHLDLSTGSHTIEIDYRRPGGGTVSIKDVRVEFWRAGTEDV